MAPAEGGRDRRRSSSLAVSRCLAAGEGTAIELELGGKLDPVHGRPLPVGGVVRRLAPGDPVGGNIAVVRAGGVSVIVTERRKLFHRLSDFTVLGLEPSAAKVVIVKLG